MNTELNTKDEIWKNLKANLTALNKPKNLLLMGSLGTGKSSFINTVITALTGKYKYYADVGRGSKHNTTRLHIISCKDYWNPENKEIEAQNLPTFIDIIGMVTQQLTSKEEETISRVLLRLIIDGQIPENCDLFDLSKKLKNGEKIKKRPNGNMATVDIIIVVISAENCIIPTSLLDEIYEEANIKTKQIPVFLVLTNVDKCNLSEKGLEEKKNDICMAMSIEPYKVLMCSNYQPDDKPNIEKDIKILEFLAKLCDPCFKAVTLQKMECEKPAPSILHASTTFPKADGPFVMTGAFICLFLAFLIGLILRFVSKI